MAIKYYERYPQRWESPSNDYPQGAFKNLSALGEQDGSYLEKDWLNDYSGFFGALLRNAQITPNGLVDTAQRSQFYDALIKVAKSAVADQGYATTSYVDAKVDNIPKTEIINDWEQASDENVFSAGLVSKRINQDADGNTIIKSGAQTFTFPPMGGVLSVKGHTLLSVDSREDISALQIFPDVLKINNFYADGRGKGGVYHYNADMPRTEANGGSILDPTIKFENIAQYLEESGKGSGNGCYVSVVHKDRYYDIEDFGAIVGIDCHAVFNHIFELCHYQNNTTVFVPDGVYTVAQNTDCNIQADNFKLILKGTLEVHNTFALSWYADSHERRWSNIYIGGGGTVKNLGTSTSFHFDLFHVDGVLVENLRLEGVSASSHFLDFSGSTKLRVSNIHSIGGTSSDRDYAELIQIASDSPLGYGTSQGGKYVEWMTGGNYSKDILIENCIFETDYNISEFPHLRAVGNHSNYPTDVHINLTIRGCTFRNIHTSQTRTLFEFPSNNGVVFEDNLILSDLGNHLPLFGNISTDYSTPNVSILRNKFHIFDTVAGGWDSLLMVPINNVETDYGFFRIEDNVIDISGFKGSGVKAVMYYLSKGKINDTKIFINRNILNGVLQNLCVYESNHKVEAIISDNSILSQGIENTYLVDMRGAGDYEVVLEGNTASVSSLFIQAVNATKGLFQIVNNTVLHGTPVITLASVSSNSKVNASNNVTFSNVSTTYKIIKNGVLQTVPDSNLVI